MIKYAKRISKERKMLQPKIRVGNDIIGVISILFGAYLYLFLITNYFSLEYNVYMENSPYLFWPIFIIGLLAFYSIGQFIVLGIVSIVLVFKGTLTISDAINYTFLYKMPKQWFRGRNA